MEEKQSTPEDLANKAIEFLDLAGDYEDKNNIVQALENYQKALNYLIESGYLPHREEDIRNHIIELEKQIESKDKSKELVRKTQKEKLQEEAFLLLDQGKYFELEADFKKALSKYDSAISLLTEAGWSDSQLQNLKNKRNTLMEDYGKKKEIKKQKIVRYMTQKADRSNLKVDLENLPELSEESSSNIEYQKLEQYFETHKEENEIKEKAFKLIDDARALEQQEKWDESINSLREAIDLLKIIDWSSYIEPLKNQIIQIEQKKESQKRERKQREKREEDLLALKQSIRKKRKEKLEEINQSKIDKKREIEEKKALKSQKEDKLFTLLNRADKLINNEDYDAAISHYEEALQLIEDVGSGWESYVDTIQETIKNIKNTKENVYNIQYQQQKKKELEIKQKEEFQEYISKELKRERKKLEEKEIELKDRDEEIQYREKLKDKAFKFIETAQNDVMDLKFDKAIEYYQKARNIFAEIQWTDEIPLLDISINELVKRKKELTEQKNKEMEKRIKKLEEDEDFQKRIRQQLQLERKKLKEKEIKLEEKENELQYQREEKEKALELLEKAQNAIEEKNYKAAIDLYREAAKIFSLIQWKDEAKLIRNSIIELENKRKEEMMQKEKDLQKALAREKERHEFQMQITKQIEAKREELEEKQMRLREREEELIYRKGKRAEAFKKLDEANQLLSQGKFEESLEIYYEVKNIFAQIQWIEELPLINETIEQIKEKKKQKEVWEQEAVNQEIKKELERSAFMEMLAREREFERKKELERRRDIEIQKQITEEAKQKQKDAFNIIEKADSLLQQQEFDKALSNYNNAMEILKSIGWSEGYLRLLRDTIRSIKKQKEEQLIKQIQEEKQLKQLEQENMEFQAKMSKIMEWEQIRLEEKELSIEEHKKFKEKQNEMKQKAFNILEEAEQCLNEGDYDGSIEHYREAELILNQIQFPTDLIKETIMKIKSKQKEEEIAKQNELELKLKREQEEKILEQKIAERMKLEQERMKEKEIELARQKEIEKQIELKRQRAFKLLDEAQKLIDENDFDYAVELYHIVLEIFEDINWTEEGDLIRNSIFEIEQQKKEMEKRKIRELREAIEQQETERLFREQIKKEAQLKQQKIEEQKIRREKEETLEKQVEVRKKGAFILLDLAEQYLSNGNYNEAIDVYYDVANVFAEIQWNEEIPRIHDAIEEIKQKREEERKLREEQLKREIKKEEADKRFVAKIQESRNKQKIQELKQRELNKIQKELSTQKEEKRKRAFKIIEDADTLLKEENYNEAIQVYRDAIKILTEIGWEGPYLKILKETLEEIKQQKEKKEVILQKEKEREEHAKIADEEFQKKITDSLKREEERLRKKQVEMIKIKQIQEKKSELKEKAFDIIDEAETLVKEAQYDYAIDKYREAELILNQIQFPTTAIKEKLQKLEEAKREEDYKKQKDFISQLQEERRDEVLQKQISQRMKLDREKLEAKKKRIQKQEVLQNYIERNKEKAFNLLDKAEDLTKKGDYEDALNLYEDAEIILSELNFPTKAIDSLIIQVREKSREAQLRKQKQLEEQIQREQKEIKFQQEMSRRMESEKQKVLQKKIRVEKFEERRKLIEQKRAEAFDLLDEADSLIEEDQFESAIEYYKKAQLMLNQINYPPDSIDEMVNRIMEMQENKEKERLEKYQLELNRMQKEKDLENLVETRKRQEEEKKRTKQIALQQREKFIEQQKNYREAAYALLDKASEHLKRWEPEYNAAISLYIEARDILAERIGWEPEINNLNKLITDLQKEKQEYYEKIERNKQIEQQREEEYKEFLEDIQLRQREDFREQKQKELEIRKYKKHKLKLEEMRNAGLEYIEQGKRLASYQRFEEAYNMLEQAIQTFRMLGWKDQIGYIQKEIEHVKKLEEKAETEQLERKRIQHQKEIEKRAKELEKIKEERELKEQVGQVGTIAKSVSETLEEERIEEQLKKQREKEEILRGSKEFGKSMGAITKNVSETLEEERIEEQLKKQREKEQLLRGSKEFGKSMGKMIKLREELIKKLEEERKKKEEEKQKKLRNKKRKEVDEIKKMLKETSKKNKKNE